jgi:hypothetical protein
MTKFNRHKSEVITDNDEAFEIVKALGLLDEFLNEQELFGEAMFCSVSVRTYKRHGTHWILAGYFHKRNENTEKGYFVAIWPKRLFRDSILDEVVAGYAWGHLDGKHDERTRFVAVLEIPPVESAETAVRVQIVKDVKEKRGK